MLEPFEILGLSPETATPDAVRKSYRDMARRVHPDQPQGSAEAMSRLSSARCMLADAEAIEYWQLHLAGRRAPLRLPPDRPMPIPSKADQTALGPVTMGIIHDILEGGERDFRRRAFMTRLGALVRFAFGRVRNRDPQAGMHLPATLSCDADAIRIDYRSKAVPGPNLMVIPQIMRCDETDAILVSWAAGRAIERRSDAGGNVAFEADEKEIGTPGMRMFLRLMGEEQHLGLTRAKTGLFRRTALAA